jgi:hypothetical protein
MMANTEDEKSYLSKLHTIGRGQAPVFDLILAPSKGSRTSCNPSIKRSSEVGYRENDPDRHMWCANSRKISGTPSSNTRFVLTLQSFTRYSVEVVHSSLNRRRSTTRTALG